MSKLIDRLREFRIILKSGEYDGADLMASWCAMSDAAKELEFLKAENAGLAAALRKYGRHDDGALSYHPCKQAGMNADLFPCTCGLDAALSAGPLEKGHE